MSFLPGIQNLHSDKRDKREGRISHQLLVLRIRGILFWSLDSLFFIFNKCAPSDLHIGVPITAFVSIRELAKQYNIWESLPKYAVSQGELVRS